MYVGMQSTDMDQYYGLVQQLHMRQLTILELAMIGNSNKRENWESASTIAKKMPRASLAQK